ncbi:MAG: hypothetical protein EXR29_05555 [Betaproteobacteria bacterium]|nr:hypothetical protein [Betaproteobacteria bacterium]
MPILILLFLFALPARGQDPAPITVLEHRELPIERNLSAPTHHLKLTLAYLEGGGWSPDTIHAGIRQGVQIFAQCGVALENVELLRVGAPDRFRDFYSPVSRELARTLVLRKPTIYFIAGTRQRPGFDAEAIGRGNSRTRPELRDTVWVTRGARDLGIVLAHELAHVLMDSGEHSDEAGNLMREDTAPENTRLSEAQCARLRDAGTVNGLLKSDKGLRLRIR